MATSDQTNRFQVHFLWLTAYWSDDAVASFRLSSQDNHRYHSPVTAR